MSSSPDFAAQGKADSASSLIPIARLALHDFEKPVIFFRNGEIGFGFLLHAVRISNVYSIAHRIPARPHFGYDLFWC